MNCVRSSWKQIRLRWSGHECLQHSHEIARKQRRCKECPKIEDMLQDLHKTTATWGCLTLVNWSAQKLRTIALQVAADFPGSQAGLCWLHWELCYHTFDFLVPKPSSTKTAWVHPDVPHTQTSAAISAWLLIALCGRQKCWHVTPSVIWASLGEGDSHLQSLTRHFVEINGKGIIRELAMNWNSHQTFPRKEFSLFW